MIIILGVLAVLVSTIIIVVFVKVRKDEVQECYDAAQNIIKESKLNNTLKNPYVAGISKPDDNIKPMLYIKIKGKKDLKYVFDPQTVINIGRDKQNNQLCINEAIVSGKHCRIIANGRHVILQDLNSTNGVCLKRGMKKSMLSGGASVEIYTKDKVKIGTTVLEITIFYFDVLYM